MIIYVDMEHRRLRANAALWEKSLANLMKTRYRLEEASGHPCLIIRYPRVSPVLLRELGVHAVVVSGNHTDWEHYAREDLAGLRAIFREAAWPTLAFCGGFQMLAQAYGAEIGPMGPSAPGDPEPSPGLNYPPGMRQEHGFMPVRVVESHPVFAGLGPQPVVFQSHYWEVKMPPPGFRVLAESDMCRLQAIAHQDAPLFGVQFHPEHYDEQHPDGRHILENFLKLAETQNPTSNLQSRQVQRCFWSDYSARDRERRKKGVRGGFRPHAHPFFGIPHYGGVSLSSYFLDKF